MVIETCGPHRNKVTRAIGGHGAQGRTEPESEVARKALGVKEVAKTSQPDRQREAEKIKFESGEGAG